MRAVKCRAVHTGYSRVSIVQVDCEEWVVWHRPVLMVSINHFPDSRCGAKADVLQRRAFSELTMAVPAKGGSVRDLRIRLGFAADFMNGR